MRAVAVIILFLTAAFVALWQLDVIKLDIANRGATGVSARTQDFLEVLQTGTLEQVRESLANDSNLAVQDRDGKTPLMYAATGTNDPRVIFELVNAGASLDVQSDDGRTPLMHAALENNNPEIVLALLNAGADPTVLDAEGRSVYDLAGDNGILARTRVYERLEDLTTANFDPTWPSGYIVPVNGANFSSRINHLPNAPRAYRNGVHEGYDFFNYNVGVTINYGTPVVSVASGIVKRVDQNYVEMSALEYADIINEASIRPITPPESLDKLRGRQIWIEHPGGYISRYAHLLAAVDDLAVGDEVSQGQTIGFIGNSGTEEAVNGVQDEPHVHYELWLNDQRSFLGENLPPEAIYELLSQVFGAVGVPTTFTE